MVRGRIGIFARGHLRNAWPGSLRITWLWLLPFLAAVPVRATPLDDYVHAPDTNFAWRVLERGTRQGYTYTRVGFISQRWQGLRWTNFLTVVEPPVWRNPNYCALLVVGDTETNYYSTAAAAARRAGAWSAILSHIPNQPLFAGRREDALVAYTFDRYLKTGDDTWPVLLPMVKSAVRAMDLVQILATNESLTAPDKFVVNGASKRGLTTWLTAAVDPRVAGIGPMVFDMLNFKAQTDWAQKVYGHQSEMIHNYTELGLVAQMDTPAMAQLRGSVDPYTYRDRYTLPKLILLGSNDPFWTVDSTRHYWNDLPGPKLIYDSPNTGHGLKRDSTEAFCAFFQMLADGQPLPDMKWKFIATGSPAVQVTFDRPAKTALLWSADTASRDFRKANWSHRELEVTPETRRLTALVDPPRRGHRAFMMELTFAGDSGDYKLSTQVQVIPDDIH